MILMRNETWKHENMETWKLEINIDDKPLLFCQFVLFFFLSLHFSVSQHPIKHYYKIS